MNVKVLFPNKQVELQPLRLDVRLYVSSVLFLCLPSSLLLTRLSSQVGCQCFLILESKIQTLRHRRDS